MLPNTGIGSLGRVATVLAPLGSRQGSMLVFDRAVKRAQRARAALAPHGSDYDYLRAEVADRVVDRLDDITRDFKNVLDLGCGNGHVLHAMVKAGRVGGVAGPRAMASLTQVDSSEEVLALAEQRAEEVMATIAAKAKAQAAESSVGAAAVGSEAASAAAVSSGGAAVPEAVAPTAVYSLCADEELLPFEPEQFDLVTSSMSLHWVNDLPGALIQAAACLKPDGVFVGAFLGGQTLSELRSAILVAEQEREGGVSARLSPLANVADAGNLLQRAGFNLPTCDTDLFTIDYPDPFTLMEHVAGMGEANACLSRRTGPMSRETLMATAFAYQELFGNADGTVPATFQVVHMLGWKPHETQQKPKARGSATRSMKELQKEVKVHSSTDSPSDLPSKR